MSIYTDLGRESEMTRAKEREEFLYIMAQEGVPLDVARKLLRYGATLHRLAEAACNGDWPCDNGERKVEWCPRCEGGYVKSTFRQAKTLRVEEAASKGTEDGLLGPKPMICPDCRAQEIVELMLIPFGAAPVFQGDPRGCVFKVKVKSGRTNDGGREGICVPA